MWSFVIRGEQDAVDNDNVTVETAAADVDEDDNEVINNPIS